jgi:predicted nucleic acid-binding protein
VKPQAVFVETNWVVDVVAPAHLQSPQAIQLLRRAEAGEFELYLPAICLTEARETVPRRFAPRSRSEDLRKFVRWARDEGRIPFEDAEAAFRVFEQFDGLVANELTRVAERLDELATRPHLEVFPLSESMLERQVSVGAANLALKPYDLAILAAFLVKAEELQQAGHGWVGFCELDSDLQPWDKFGARKLILSDFYDAARIWVYGDFLVENIAQLPKGWITTHHPRKQKRRKENQK